MKKIIPVHRAKKKKENEKTSNRKTIKCARFAIKTQVSKL